MDFNQNANMAPSAHEVKFLAERTLKFFRRKEGARLINKGYLSWTEEDGIKIPQSSTKKELAEHQKSLMLYKHDIV